MGAPDQYAIAYVGSSKASIKLFLPEQKIDMPNSLAGNDVSFCVFHLPLTTFCAIASF
jgi:hypothetical protein